MEQGRLTEARARMGALTALVVVASQQYRRCCIPSLRKIRSWHAGQYRSQLDGHIEIDNSP